MVTILSSRNTRGRPGRRRTRWLDGSGTLAILAAVIAVIAFAACETVAGTHGAGARVANFPVAE